MKKEKRILIREFTTSPCTGCSGASENACDNCYDWDTWNSCLTRKQAIYKMAKALCHWYYHECSECALKDKPKECRRFLKDSDFCEQAKAALNALLGAENEN